MTWGYMNEFRHRCGLVFPTVLFAAVFAGCGAAPEAAKSVGSAKPDVAKAAAPALAPAAVATAKPAAETKPAKKLNLNPFQMPEIPEEFLPPKEEPKSAESAAPTKQTERPKLRLLGFSNVDGFKALVELKGDVQAVQAGDVIEGVQVVSVEPPNVTFQFASSRWATKLFDQPWHNEQTGVASSPGASRAFSTQSRAAPRASTGATSSRLPAPAGARIPAVPSILGSGIPRIGAPPTAEMPPPIGGSVGSVAGMPIAGAAAASIPGISGPAGMPSAPGAVPGVPYGAPSGTSATPGATAMPSGPIALPGIPGN
jgi:hypothetical protein